MHLSMHNWMRSESLEVTLERLARFGYESIELSGEPERYDTAEVRGLLNAYTIRCWGAVTLMMGDRNMLAKDAEDSGTVRAIRQGLCYDG